jgi:hypothetical protein
MRGGGEYDWLMDLMEEDEARREDRTGADLSECTFEIRDKRMTEITPSSSQVEF